MGKGLVPETYLGGDHQTKLLSKFSCSNVKEKLFGTKKTTRPVAILRDVISSLDTHTHTQTMSAEISNTIIALSQNSNIIKVSTNLHK